MSLTACAEVADSQPQQEPAAARAPAQEVALVSAVLNESEVFSSQASVDPASVGPKDGRLRVKLENIDGPSVPMLNGGLVNLGDGLQAEVFVDPYPTYTLTAWVDLYLGDQATGEPINDAHVLFLYDMWSMSHGPYTGLAENSINGHYVFRLDYIMFGAWEQVFEVRLPGNDKVYRLVLVIVAIP